MLVVKTGIEVLRQKSKVKVEGGGESGQGVPKERAVSCKLGLIETTGPTEGSQHRVYWGGPANGQAAACRRQCCLSGTLLLRNGVLGLGTGGVARKEVYDSPKC